MTAIETVSTPGLHPVAPVIDYEPRPGAPRSHLTAGPRRRRRPRVLHRQVPDTPEPEARLHQASAFADAALRRILEVLDRRRPTGHLGPLLATGLIDSVAAHLDGPPGTGAAAMLRRVRLQATDADGHAYEVAASYARGSRRHALACRIELQPTRWQVVALHLG